MCKCIDPLSYKVLNYQEQEGGYYYHQKVYNDSLPLSPRGSFTHL